MKNINLKLLFWSILISALIPLSISAQPGITSNRNVLFLHGLEGTSGSWAPFINRFTVSGDTRRMNPFNQTYSSSGGLSAIASGVSTNGSNSAAIAICHSMGGVIARRKDANGSLGVGGIVTVGSPLDGAPIANAVADGTAVSAMASSASTMARGPLATLGFIFSPLITVQGNVVLASTLTDLISSNLDVNDFGGMATINDLKVGGAGVEQDKAATPTLTPKISIWGNETTPIHWNFLSTITETDVVEMADDLSTFYELSFFLHLGIGAANWYNAWGWWSFYAAFEWYNGWDWIDNDSERIWNNLIGSDAVVSQCFTLPSSFCSYPDDRCDDTPSNWQYCQVICTPVEATVCVQVHNNGISDAFIPATSQRGNGSNSWRIRTGNGTLSDEVPKIEALGVNHFEERDAANAVMRATFNDVFLGSRGAIFRIDKP
jgi:pimeloyl-ACP methyl ester carboxylesterase